MLLSTDLAPSYFLASHGIFESFVGFQILDYMQYACYCSCIHASWSQNSHSDRYLYSSTLAPVFVKLILSNLFPAGWWFFKGRWYCFISPGFFFQLTSCCSVLYDIACYFQDVVERAFMVENFQVTSYIETCGQS